MCASSIPRVPSLPHFVLHAPRQTGKTSTLLALRDLLNRGAFNVKAKSLRLGDFPEEGVRSLLAQHAKEAGQAFAPDAVATIWRQTRGQPWLVNALAAEACFENEAGTRRRVRSYCCRRSCSGSSTVAGESCANMAWAECARIS